MKKLFIYFSLTGNGDYVASQMENKGYVIRKVEEKAKAPKSFFWRVFIGGFRAGIMLKGKLINYNNDVSEYDEIVIGSPVWSGLFPPAINSVLAQTNFEGKKVSFVFYSGSGTMPKAADIIKAKYPGAEIVSLKDPRTHELELEKLSIF